MNKFVVRIQQWLDGKAVKFTSTEVFGVVAVLIAIIAIRSCS